MPRRHQGAACDRAALAQLTSLHRYSCLKRHAVAYSYVGAQFSSERWAIAFEQTKQQILEMEVMSMRCHLRDGCCSRRYSFDGCRDDVISAVHLLGGCQVVSGVHGLHCS